MANYSEVRKHRGVLYCYEDNFQYPPQSQSNAASTCDVCLLNPRDPIALVPCGHARFCRSCMDTLRSQSNNCPICRTAITLVMQVFV